MHQHSNQISVFSDTEILIRALEKFKMSLLELETIRLKSELELLEAIDQLNVELTNILCDK